MKLYHFIMVAAVCLAGCSPDPNLNADALAGAANMKRERVKTDSFILTGFARITHRDQPLNVYIEGDGFAWRTSDEPSFNPTPRKALALALAGADPSANVVYIARPCQFTPFSMDAHCNEAYWTNKRFAPEVIASVNQAISHFAAQAPKQKINLVGYSGGGAVAALVAAERTDVATLRTIAGNLDVEAFNAYHHVSAMPQSLNPVNVAARLRALPQEHFVGDEDDMVPALLAENFVKAMGDSHCAAITHVPHASHEDGWLEFWRSAVLKLPVCH